jgi:hypothetical protein
MRVVVQIPCLNEAQTPCCPGRHAGDRRGGPGRSQVIDDGRADGTSEVARCTADHVCVTRRIVGWRRRSPTTEKCRQMISSSNTTGTASMGAIFG